MYDKVTVNDKNADIGASSPKTRRDMGSMSKFNIIAGIIILLIFIIVFLFI